MMWEERIAAYAKALPGFPVSMAIGGDGRVFGMFRMGNDYTVKSGFYGGYPATYLKRIKALFPDKRKALHLFSGKVDLAVFPGDTVDINTDLAIEHGGVGDGRVYTHYIDDAQTLTRVPLEKYDLVLADPPYSVEDAEHYKTTMVKRNTVMRALSRLPKGAHIVWLDQVLPMYRKDTWKLEAEIGIVKSTNHRFRVVTIWSRR